MITSLRRGLLGGVLAAALAGLTLSQANAQPTPGSRVHVLLIGVQDYADAGLASLNGPGNDVELMREVLTGRFGIPRENIRLLLNPKHSVIQQAFVDLAKTVRPGDMVYIHYSGHGSTAADPDDPRGADQTWVSYGARARGVKGIDGLDVLDKEIAVWMQPLYALSDDVVFVSDSCHSGTVSRGSGVRSVPPAGPPHPLLASLSKVPTPTTGLRIGAARDIETAVELDRRTSGSCNADQNCYGVFTWNWAQALQQSRPGESWGDVFDRTVARVTTNPSVYQQPQIEGRADRAVFGARFAPLTQTVSVAKVEPDGAVVLNAGLLAGVTVGSLYRSIPAETSSSTTELRVSAVQPLTSRANVTGGALKAGDLVTETVHAYSAAKIRLFVEAGPADAAQAAKVRADLTAAMRMRLSAFTLTQRADDADWRLKLVRSAGAPPQLVVVSRLGRLMNERLRIDLQRYDTEFDRLVDDLSTFAWSQEVRSLAAQGNVTPVRLDVTIHRPPPGDTAACSASQTQGSGWTAFGPFPLNALKTAPVFGDCLSFELRNQAEEDRTWYGYVVAVGPDFAVHPIFPSPTFGTDAARMARQEHLSSAGIFYRLDQPGRETLLLLASEAPVRVQALQRAAMRSAPASRLEGLLTAMSNQRGDVESTSAWGATSLDIEVVGPGGPKPMSESARP